MTIAIAISGGMDSAILLYELLQNHDKVICISNAVLDKGSNTVCAAAHPDFIDSTKKLLKKFNTSKIIHKCTSTYGIEHGRGILRAAHLHNVRELYFGTSKLYNGAQRLYSDKSGEYFGKTRILQPYYNLYKHDIIKKYYDYNLLDIMAATNSCDKNTTPCYKCEGCIDRKIGFEKYYARNNDMRIRDDCTTD